VMVTVFGAKSGFFGARTGLVVGGAVLAPSTAGEGAELGAAVTEGVAVLGPAGFDSGLGSTLTGAGGASTRRATTSASESSSAEQCAAAVTIDRLPRNDPAASRIEMSADQLASAFRFNAIRTSSVAGRS